MKNLFALVILCLFADGLKAQNPCATFTIDAGPDKAICIGATAQIGTVPPPSCSTCTYSWSPNHALTSINSPRPFASPLQTTTYTLVVNDTNGCTASDKVVVLVNQLPPADAGSDRTICIGQITVLGVPAIQSCSYTWTPSIGLSSSNTPQPNASPSANTTYTLVVTNLATACSAMDHVVVNVNPKPFVDAGPDKVICFASSVFIGTTGIIGYSYSWNPANDLSNGTIAQPSCGRSGAYTVIVTNSSTGCTASDDVIVSMASSPTVAIFPNHWICNPGDTITIGAVVQAGNTYSWTPTSSLSTPNSPRTVASPQSNTTYTLTATNQFGCQSTSDLSLFVGGVGGIPAAGPDQAYCPGSTVKIGEKIAGASYMWSPPAGLSSVTDATPTANPSVQTTYTVTTTNPRGCNATDEVVVFANLNQQVTILNNRREMCSGVKTDIVFNGNLPGMGYMWTVSGPMAGASAGTGTNFSQQTLTNQGTVPLTVTYTITPFVGQCKGLPSFTTVTVLPVPTAQLVNTTPTLCSNTTASLAINTVMSSVSYTWTQHLPSNVSGGAASGSGMGSFNVSALFINNTSFEGTVTYTVTMTSGPSCSLNYSTTVKVFPADCDNVISGYAYLDVNKNCQKDAGEGSVANLRIVSSPLNQECFTNSSGYYEMLLPSGSYTIAVAANQLYFAKCPAPQGQHNVSLTNNNIVSGKDFGVTSADTCARLALNIVRKGVVTNLRPCTTAIYRIDYTNHGQYDQPNAQLTLVLPPELSFSSSLPAYTTQSGATYTYTLGNVAAGSSGFIEVITDVSCAAVMGRFICVKADILPKPVCLPNWNANHIDRCEEVRNSYDPNEKLVDPPGDGPKYYVKQGKKLRYHVGFQNTGNDVAFHIIVRDTLSQHLNPESVKALYATHNYSLSVEGGNILVWRFQNIMLVDSFTNEPASHGFFEYEIEQMPNLPDETVINNSAAIYFDFNSPIITNVASITMGELKTGIKSIEKDKFHIYPNPASTLFSVSYFDYIGKTIEVHDLTGRKLEEHRMTSSELKLQSGHLLPCIYLLQLKEGNTTLYSEKLFIK